MSSSGERSEFHIPRMDCPCEERMVRMALESETAVRQLDFDLPARRLTVWHATGAAAGVAQRLEPLGLGARLVESHAAVEVSEGESPSAALKDGAEARTLKVLLAINAVMFVVEAVAGWVTDSAGLLADSLDMFADASVYGMALWAVGRAGAHKLQAARFSGIVQLALALGMLAEVARRVVAGSEPEAAGMLGIAFLALVANAACLVLITRHREAGVHMRASYIFSSSDVIANAGVMAAGALVAATGSRLPDLVIGSAIGVVVLWGAVRILRLR